MITVDQIAKLITKAYREGMNDGFTLGIASPQPLSRSDMWGSWEHSETREALGKAIGQMPNYEEFYR